MSASDARLRIGLFGLFGGGNFGNDASLEAMLNTLRRDYPDAELLCFCTDPEKVHATFGVDCAPLYAHKPSTLLFRVFDKVLQRFPSSVLDWWESIRLLRGLKALIVPGTGLLDDFGSGPRGVPNLVLRWCGAARLNHVRTAFVSIGAGPIRHSLSRMLFKQAAKWTVYRSYRDQQSKAFMNSIGFDASQDGVYADLVFGLPKPAAAPRSDNKLCVGVGVMTYYGWRNDPVGGAAIYAAYLEKLVRLVGWLRGQGHRVRLLMGETTDLAMLEDVLKAAATQPGEPLLSEPMNNLHDLMAQIADTDIVVATRFHTVLCALKMGKPTISLSYATKNDVLMADMGLSGLSHHVETFDVDAVIAQVQTLIAERETYEARLIEANARNAALLAQQETRLHALFQ